jgi:chromosome segregation ATPase
VIAPTPTQILEMIDATKLRIPDWPVGDQLSKYVTKHNAAVAELMKRQNECQAVVSTIKGSQLSMDDLRERRDRLAHGRLKICQDQVSLLEARAGLLESMRDYLTETAAKLDQELGRAVENVCAQLKRAGIVLETMDAWPSNQRSAENQLDHIIKTRESVRGAKAAYETLAALLPPCNELIRETWSAIEDAEWQLEKLVETMVGTS